MSNEIKSIKIISHDIINSIDNLEYLEGTDLNRYSTEDKLLLKFENELKDNENPIERSDDYKKVIKYLKDNNISDITIYDNKPIIIKYLRNNNDINLETLKDTILKNDKKYEEHNENRERNIINSSIITSGGSSQFIKGGGDFSYRCLRCVIKMTEYTPISGGNLSELNKITELFLNKRSLLILKNNGNKCFLYCYIRKFLNPIAKNSFRITKKDKKLTDKIINETNLTFENVSINEMNKTEKILEININVFSCNRNYKNKNPVRKSKENYDKTLDLLLIEDINHHIIIENLHCFLTNICTMKDNFIRRSCLNIFYSKIKYDGHINYCKTRKPQRLLPSNEKYIKFNKLQNRILNNFTIYSDFECIIDKSNEHKFIFGGYLVKCRNDKFTKTVQMFDNLDDYSENLKNELKYIEKINDKHLEYVIFLKTEINMKLEIKEIKDEFPEYETNVNTDDLPKNKIICKNNKVIHHDHLGIIF